MDKKFCFKQIDAIKKLDENFSELKIVSKINSYLLDSNIDVFNLKQRKDEKKILSVEVRAGHDVIRPSIWKYFTDLGYKVDFLLYGNQLEDRWNFFTRVENYQSRELVGDEAFILSVLSLPIMAEYDYIFFNSNFVYTQNRLDTNYDYRNFMRILKVPGRCKYGFLTIPPHPAFYTNNDKDVLFFSHLGTNNSPMLSVSYFGDVKITPKSNKNIFLVSGNINTGQKNHDMIFDAISQLLDEGINNFEVWVNGTIVGKFKIPEKLQNYIKYVGENKPETLFSIIEKADFILSGIDSKSEYQRNTYSRGTCSVGLMYSLGFGKIYICEDIFAKAFGLTNDNSIIYKSDFLVSALKRAINMTRKDYEKMQNSILEEADRRYKRSLNDIYQVLQKLKKIARKCSFKKLLQQIFSVRNEANYKVCRILGLEKKFSRRGWREQL